MVVIPFRPLNWFFAIALVMVVTLPFAARAEILFEGYSKILLGGEHVGFAVQRYEFDPKKKEFSTIYYLKTNAAGGNITESLKARSTATLKPLSYQYTELSGDKARTIDANFKGDKMTAVVKEGGKQQTINKTLPKGTFLVSFLGYLMLQGKEGIKSGVKYGYQAIAEEDGNIYAGDAQIVGEETFAGVGTFKVVNTFKGSQFVSYVTNKAEIIGTRSPVQQIATELVPSIKEATAGISVNTSNLSLLFGGVPKGNENVIARLHSSPPAATASTGTPSASKQTILNKSPTPSPESPKKEGVPAGVGITVKGATPSAPAAPSSPSETPPPEGK